MSSSRIQQIIDALTENAGQTPAELGLTSVDANTLVKAGVLVQGDRRRTPGKIGAPPFEYHLPNAERPAKVSTIDPSYRDGLRLSDDDARKLDYIDRQLVSPRLDATDHLVDEKKQIIRRASKGAKA